MLTKHLVGVAINTSLAISWRQVSSRSKEKMEETGVGPWFKELDCQEK